MKLQVLTSRLGGALSLAGITLTSGSAQAAQPFVVQDIRIEGLKRVEAGTLFAYLPIKQGSLFSDDKASEAIRALYATGFFNEVRISTEGNVVIVYVQERPAVGTIDFAGIHEFDKENLTKALGSVGLSQGRYYDKALVDKAEQELKRRLDAAIACNRSGVLRGEQVFHHVEHDQRGIAEIGEALPHLSREQPGQAGRMAKNIGPRRVGRRRGRRHGVVLAPWGIC